MQIKISKSFGRKLGRNKLRIIGAWESDAKGILQGGHVGEEKLHRAAE